jgi:hypothetical protein
MAFGKVNPVSGPPGNVACVGGSSGFAWDCRPAECHTPPTLPSGVPHAGTYVVTSGLPSSVDPGCSSELLVRWYKSYRLVAAIGRARGSRTAMAEISIFAPFTNAPTWTVVRVGFGSGKKAA